MADMLYHRSFFSCKDDTLNDCVNNDNNCMVINICVQYNGGFLPDIILLTQGYYH